MLLLIIEFLDSIQVQDAWTIFQTLYLCIC